MPDYFGPYVSFRGGDNSADFAPAPKFSPGNALTRSSSLLLLIHGYNNSMTDASNSYDAWVALQKDLGGIPGRNVVAIYWPGSNWENFAFYMQAVYKSQAAAQRLAGVLRKAANDFGVLRIRIVAHSLGNRLTMELVNALRTNPDPRLQIDRFVSMAAAVPTSYLTPNHPLRQGVEAVVERFRSLYSPADKILGNVFRLGQTLAGDGFWPTALGHTEWRSGRAIPQPRLTQEEIVGAGHGDYWGGNEKTRDIARKAATTARWFLDLGASDRELTARELFSREVEPPREAGISRTTPSR